MKKTLTLAAVAAGSLVAFMPFAGYAAPDRDAMQPTVVIKDSSITSSIKAQLAADTFKGLSHIDVDTDDHGSVTLKGRVPSQDAADRAISIASATEGVRKVRSALKVRAGS